ncbi:hypothetical protein BJ741DRAFT_629182 [Chytriomyces cf. hyalinus JEL632]|nr:hypothetical protein BJ741DRAFT_629182 [Chytriomyces cf. hyalinus JEL632]
MDPEAPDKELEAAQTILMMMEVGAEREPGNDGPSGTGGESSGSALGLRPRVKPCEGCKRRRKRCDAVRPVCGTCAKLRVSCEWTPEHSSGLVSTIAAHGEYFPDTVCLILFFSHFPAFGSLYPFLTWDARFRSVSANSLLHLHLPSKNFCCLKKKKRLLFSVILFFFIFHPLLS